MKAVAIFVTGLLVGGCAGATVVPSDLKEKVDWTISFLQLKASPLSYQGRVLVLGGMVLAVKPLKQDGTRIEILQLPLDSEYEPLDRLTNSSGRFLAFHKEFIDPATIPAGTRITVVGEVTGAITLQLDEVDYSYPALDIKSMTVWSPRLPVLWGRPYPYFGAYWGSYWGPYWGPPQWIPVPSVPVERK
jgi:outer membrane lipoprotein